MSAFVVIIDGGEKHNLLDPPIIGPFPSDEAAYRFMEHHPRDLGFGCEMEPIDGGYAAYHVVSADTAGDPMQYAYDAEWLEDDVDAELTADPATTTLTEEETLAEYRGPEPPPTTTSTSKSRNWLSPSKRSLTRRWGEAIRDLQYGGYLPI